MTSVVFHDFFLKFCQEVRERPILLILDGHLTHLDVETAIYARNNQVTIIKLPAHTTDLLQPLDKTCFKTLKYTWDQNILQWYRSNQRKMQKSEFVNILCKIWHSGLTSDNIKIGFTSVGIYPCDRNKYPVSRLDPEKLSRYNSMKQQTTNNSECHLSNPRLEPPSTPSCSLSKPSTSSAAPQCCDPGPSTSGRAMALQIEFTTPSESDFQTENIPDKTSSPLISYGSLSPGTFETLLLQKIKKTEAPKKTRKRIDSGAKVITSEEWIATEKLNREKEEVERKKKEGK